MKRSIVLGLLIIVGALSIVIVAQQPPARVIEVEKLKDNLYVLKGGGGNTAAAQTLQSVSASMLAAAMSMQAADVPASAREIAACTAARVQSVAVLARWRALTTTDLAALNAKRKAAGLLAVTMGQ